MYIYTYVHIITRNTMMFYEYVCNTHVHVHVYVLYMCVQIYKLACAHCIWRLEVKVRCLSLLLYNLFWRQGLLLNLELIELMNATSPQAQVSLLFLSSQL